MTKIICTACSAELESEAKFCPDCGVRIPIPVPTAPRPQTYQAPPPQAAAPIFTAAVPVSVIAKPAENNVQLSVFGYVLTMLALSVPIIGIILAFVWAFGAKTNRARKNYCRAVLIISGMFLLLAIIGFVANYSALIQLIKLLLE